MKEVIDEHPLKAKVPGALSCVERIVTDSRFEQSLKASSSIVTTEAGMVIDLKPEQPSKALSPILVIESGIPSEGESPHR